MNDCIIGIGSNIDAEYHISEMLKLLEGHVKVVQVSKMVRTKAIGIDDQPDFTNGAVRIQTPMQMEELSLMLKQLEDQLGRDRSQPKFGPRTIDLDILIWNNKIVDPDYHTRDFLRQSAAELGFK
ncbi:MAG TPA: 2-amino-4-hydroxy-6-hydroxymethyldihydropteridine diphosphokinase [Prolixibacteraceae bacterium]|nr:2-amino-4-hydroxy-6-hydroxymethyldihydropteridine diphosphokinase [Prolixibacteraceae bacterium]